MSLELVIETSRMPNTTKIRRMCKAPENLYYLLLFSIAPEYSQKPETWQSWAEMGFALALREAPPSALDSDRIRVSLLPRPRVHQIEIESGRGHVLFQLRKVLQAIEQARRSVNQKEHEQRVLALRQDHDLATLLTNRVESAQRACGLSPAEIQAFRHPLDQALAGLTDSYITGLTSRITVAA